MENKQLRENYASLIRGYYNSIPNKPAGPIGDGKYNVYIITNLPNNGTEFHIGSCAVKNGVIEILTFKHEFSNQDVSYLKKNSFWDQLAKKDIYMGLTYDMLQYFIDNSPVIEGRSIKQVQTILLGKQAGPMTFVEVYFLEVLSGS